MGHNKHKETKSTILSSPGQLQIPEQFKSWFPPTHGHKHIRKLFKWHEQLGHGVTGSVYKIEYQNKLCALKQTEKKDKWGKMLFITESRTLSKLKHDGIIGFVDMFFDEKYYYLIMEKADFDLYHIMKQNGHTSEKKTRQIIYALLKTLKYMHAKNVVHRDLKPENIVFLTSDPANPRLIDFGDAEIAKKDKIYSEFVGTPPYMAPERLSEHKGWELKKSDIWAIGVIAYEMYCGQRCFEGKSQKEVFGRILRGEWTWPEHRTPRKKMRDFIEECLKQKAEDRPSANEALVHEWFEMFNKKKEEEVEKEEECLIDDDQKREQSESEMSINLKTQSGDTPKWQVVKSESQSIVNKNE